MSFHFPEDWLLVIIILGAIAWARFRPRRPLAPIEHGAEPPKDPWGLRSPPAWAARFILLMLTMVTISHVVSMPDVTRLLRAYEGARNIMLVGLIATSGMVLVAVEWALRTLRRQ